MRGKIGQRETSRKMRTLYSDISVIILTDTSKNSKYKAKTVRLDRSIRQLYVIDSSYTLNINM